MSFKGLGVFFKLYLRWRHSKGFGVHSPYAYRFVTEVLRPGLSGLYAYNEIEGLLSGKEARNRKLISEVKFIMRLVNFLDSRRLLAWGNSHRYGEIAAKAMRKDLVLINGQESRVSFQPSDLLLIEGADPPLSIIRQALDIGTPIYSLKLSGSLREILEMPIPNGLLLKDREKIILIPRCEMAFVEYDMNLKS